ncbi:hypothetical protein QFZ62_001716 [Clavibacter sp. B3I6]|uniref:sialate O-acetylesterase n=1 Tax=Clavibacter sp. B3I6 TaxID=3042268 RepID=UPI002784700D|nr:sialate O-acetylesterase [Clavibacter sp. B3I6]MDQ0744408.1 hypothetical protein [Clavibacter sp. B3I6]
MLIPARGPRSLGRRSRLLLTGSALAVALVLSVVAPPADGAVAAARTAGSASAPVSITAASGTAVPFLLAPTPTITGAALLGQTLTAVPGTWKPAGTALAYQWFADDTAIPQATRKAYTVVATDVSRVLTVRVIASRAGSATTERRSRPTAPVALPPFRTAPVPTITGLTVIGSTLTAKPGGWNPNPVLGYSWTRDGVLIGGATAATYRLTAEDAESRVAVSVSGTRTGVQTQSRTSLPTEVVDAAPVPTPVPTPIPEPSGEPTVPPAPAPAPEPEPAPTAPAPETPAAPTTVAPRIIGQVVVGSTVRAVTGTWAPTPTRFQYRWFLDGEAQAGETGPTLTLREGALGTRITVAVTGSWPDRPDIPRSTSGSTGPVTAPVGVADGVGHDVVVIIGQSNAQGGGLGYDPAVDVPVEGLDQLVGTVDDPDWGRVVPADDSLKHVTTWTSEAQPKLVGPGMTFGRALRADAAPGRRVLLVPAAQGGTGLTRVDAAQRYTWDPTPEPGSAEEGLVNLYANATTQIDNALALDPDNRLVAILWAQGESDARSIETAVDAAGRVAAKEEYADRLLELETGLTSRYGVVPFLVGAMVPEWTELRTARQDIDAVHRGLAELRPEVAYVPGVRGSANEGEEHIHYDAAGARAMGQAAYAAFLLKTGR